MAPMFSSDVRRTFLAAQKQGYTGVILERTYSVSDEGTAERASLTSYREFVGWATSKSGDKVYND